MKGKEEEVFDYKLATDEVKLLIKRYLKSYTDKKIILLDNFAISQWTKTKLGFDISTFLHKFVIVSEEKDHVIVERWKKLPSSKVTNIEGIYTARGVIFTLLKEGEFAIKPIEVNGLLVPPIAYLMNMLYDRKSSRENEKRGLEIQVKDCHEKIELLSLMIE